MNSKPTYLSREGESSLRQELDDLVNVRRAEVAARIDDGISVPGAYESAAQ